MRLSVGGKLLSALRRAFCAPVRAPARQAYIPYALADCASSPEMVLSASDPHEIEEGRSSLFPKHLGSVRLTQ